MINGNFKNRYTSNELEVLVPARDDSPEETAEIINTLKTHGVHPDVWPIDDIYRTTIVVWWDKYYGIEGLKNYLQRREQERKRHD